jgi:hypothetical protein
MTDNFSVFLGYRDPEHPWLPIAKVVLEYKIVLSP